MLLGGMSNGSLPTQTRPGDPRQDKLTRISLLVGIFKALNILYSAKLAEPGVPAQHKSAVWRRITVTFMLKGGVPAMLHVRQLLDARRGGL